MKRYQYVLEEYGRKTKARLLFIPHSEIDENEWVAVERLHEWLKAHIAKHPEIPSDRRYGTLLIPEK